MKLGNFSRESITRLINKEEHEINLENNFYFKKKIHPENLKSINHVVFDALIKAEDKNLNVVLIKNKDNKYNLDTMDKIERLAHLNKITKTGINFYHMHNSEENLAYLVHRYGEGYRNLINLNYPLLIVIRNDKIDFVTQKFYLRQKNHSDDDLNKEIHNCSI